jgi:hypothetical protein
VLGIQLVQCISVRKRCSQGAQGDAHTQHAVKLAWPFHMQADKSAAQCPQVRSAHSCSWCEACSRGTSCVYKQTGLSPCSDMCGGIHLTQVQASLGRRVICGAEVTQEGQGRACFCQGHAGAGARRTQGTSCSNKPRHISRWAAHTPHHPAGPLSAQPRLLHRKQRRGSCGRGTPWCVAPAAGLTRSALRSTGV